MAEDDFLQSAQELYDFVMNAFEDQDLPYDNLINTYDQLSQDSVINTLGEQGKDVKEGLLYWKEAAIAAHEANDISKFKEVIIKYYFVHNAFTCSKYNLIIGAMKAATHVFWKVSYKMRNRTSINETPKRRMIAFQRIVDEICENDPSRAKMLQEILETKSKEK